MNEEKLCWVLQAFEKVWILGVGVVLSLFVSTVFVSMLQSRKWVKLISFKNKNNLLSRPLAMHEPFLFG